MNGKQIKTHTRYIWRPHTPSHATAHTLAGSLSGALRWPSILTPFGGRHARACHSLARRSPHSCLGMLIFGGKFCWKTDGSRACTCQEVLRSREQRLLLSQSMLSSKQLRESQRHAIECVCARKNFDYFLASLVTVFQVRPASMNHPPSSKKKDSVLCQFRAFVR